MGSSRQISTAIGGTCMCAEIIWDPEDAAIFRDLCRRTLGKDCVCEQGRPCPLKPVSADRVVKLLLSIRGASKAGDIPAMFASENALKQIAARLRAAKAQESTTMESTA